MYTVVKAQPRVNQQRQSRNQARPEVIDHRGGEKGIPRGASWVENIPYKTLKYQRDALLESEIVYKKQLKELHKDKDDLLKIYEPTFEENKYLKSIINHGPDAVKMKKLSKAKRDLEFELDRLKDENKRLLEQMKSIQNAANSKTRDEVLERQWQTILTSQSKAETNQTDPEKQPLDKNDDTLEDTPRVVTNDDNEDAYDLKLGTVKKSIQTLLNNVIKLQREKKKVDYALTTRKRAIVGNESLQNAIKERLDNDLQLFNDHVTAAETKTKELTEQIADDEIKIESNAKLNDIDPADRQHQDQLSQRQKTSIVPQSNLQLTQREMTMVKRKLVTVETQTDTPQNADWSSNELKPRGYKKKKKPSVESRAIQTEFPKIESKSTKPIKSYKNNKTNNESASKTKRRLEYAEKLLTNRSINEHDDIEQESEDAGTLEKSHIRQNAEVNKKSDSKHKKQIVVSEKESDTRDKRQHKSERKHVESKQEVEANKKQPSKTNETNPSSKYLESKGAEKVNDSPNKENEKSGIRGTRTQGNGNRVKSKSVPTETDDFRDKIIDKVTLPKISSNKLAHMRGDKPLKSHQLQSLPDVRKPGRNVRTNRGKSDDTSKRISPQERPRTATTIEESRSYSDSGIHYLNVSRKDTPIYNRSIPDFDFVVPHKTGKIHYKGKPVTENIVTDSREDEYDKVLNDLTSQQDQTKTNVVNEFDKTLSAYKESKQPIRHVRKRSPSIDEDSFASQSIFSPQLFFNSDGKDITETELRDMTDR